METLSLTVSLEGIDSPDSALRELQRCLVNNTGIRVELELIPPTDEELGSKAVALVLICSLLNESLGEALQEIYHWQQQHPAVKPVLHLTGQKQTDDPIREQVEREQWHIELREPRKPPVTKNPSSGNSPKRS